MSNPTTENKTEKLFELIEGIEYAMLVTETSSGALRSRPMSARTTDSDLCVWFLTNKDSAKVLEIEENQKVNVSFSRPDDFTFISISGIASVTDDPDKIEEVWTTDAGIWFPDGKDDPDLALIRVQPTDAEFWCPKNGIFVSLFKMAKAVMDGEQPDLGRNEQVDF